MLKIQIARKSAKRRIRHLKVQFTRFARGAPIMKSTLKDLDDSFEKEKRKKS
jgi:hypothetical protein